MIKQSLLVLMAAGFGFASQNDALTQKAYDSSYLLKEYDEKIVAVSGEKDSLNHSYYPSLEATTTGNSHDLKLKVNLYAGGKYEAQKGQKSFEIKQIHEDIKIEKSNIKFNLNKALFEKEIYSQLLEIEEKKSALFKTVIEHIKIRKSVGEEVNSEALNAKENNYNETIMSIDKYRYNVELLTLKLNNMFYNQKVEFSKPIFKEDFSKVNYSDEKFLEDTIANNPNVKKLEYKILELNQKKREVKSELLPQVDAMFITKRIEADGDEPVVNNNAAGLVIKIPFASDYVYTKHSSLAMKSRIKGLKFRLTDQKIKLREEIINLSMNSQNSYKDLVNKSNFLADKEREYNEFVIKKETNSISQQLLLEKEIEFLDTKKAYLMSLLTYNIDLLNLDRILY